MSNEDKRSTNDNNSSSKEQEPSPPIGAVLGWLNLGSVSPRQATSTSQAIPTTGNNTTSTFPASPPRFIEFSQMMEANRNAQNLQLAHEIVFNKDFKLELPEYEKGSMAEKVHDTMHSAFWDILREDLQADPPRYEHVVNLIGEAKEDLKSLVLPYQTVLKQQIDEAVDLEIVKKKFEANTANPHEYIKYFIDMMSTLCAECRDEQIAKLKMVNDPVECFRGIMELLNLMKLDMANFNIRQYRPLLQQQSVNYEKSTFEKFIEAQRNMGIDPLAASYNWLERAFERIQKKITIGSYIVPDQSDGSVLPLTILNEAYMEILLWNPKNSFPETLQLDEIRFNQVHIGSMRLLIIATIIGILSHITGSILRDYESLRTLLKTQMIIILEDFPQRKLRDLLASLGEQVVKTSREELEKYNQAKIIVDNEQIIKDSILTIVDHKLTEHPVFKLLFNRYVTFVQQLLIQSANMTNSSSLSNIVVPSGLTLVMDEIITTVRLFIRLINYNKIVFNDHYLTIIKQIQQTKSTVSASTPTTN